MFVMKPRLILAAVLVLAVVGCDTESQEASIDVAELPATQVEQVATESETAEMPLAQSTDPETESDPALWKIADSDSTLYLFGTVHLLPPDLEWKTPAYEAAMADASTTITEANVDDPQIAGQIAALTMQLGANPPGVKLSDILGEERFARFAEVTAKFGLPAETMQPFKPWLAMLTASVMAIQAQGFDPNSGVDKRVTDQAEDEGDTLEYFETAEDQIRMLASLDEDEMLANFDISLEQIADPDVMLKPMLDAWKQGDEAALEEAAIDELRETSPAAFDKLLVQRNTNWADQVEKILAGSGNYFIAVGAMHLVGDDSLIDILDERGVKAERVQ